MRYFELFDSNLTLLQSATNLRFVGTFQPQFNRFFDHRFRAFRRFALADDAKFGAIGYIPAVFTRLNHSSQLWKFHHEESSPSSKSSRIVTLIAVIWRKFSRAEGLGWPIHSSRGKPVSAPFRVRSSTEPPLSRSVNEGQQAPASALLVGAILVAEFAHEKLFFGTDPRDDGHAHSRG
jgi:hypothetical protein